MWAELVVYVVTPLTREALVIAKPVTPSAEDPAVVVPAAVAAVRPPLKSSAMTL